MDISASALRSFVTVVDQGNFSDAALALNISQPALTRRIQKLENQLGVQLFDRNTRQVNLSMVGRGFIGHARRLVDELDSSLLSIREIAERTSGQVTIACVPTAAFHFLPAVIRAFAEEFPRIRVKIIDDGANLVLRSVLQGDAELGIDLIGLQEPEIDFESMLREPFVLACPPDHPLAKSRQVRWEELAEHRLIIASRNSGNRLLIDQSLGSRKWKPRTFYEVQHLTTALGMVEAGLGVAALPAMTIPQGPHTSLVSRPLVSPRVERTVGIIRRRGIKLSPAASAFYGILKAKWRNIGDSGTIGQFIAPHDSARNS